MKEKMYFLLSVVSATLLAFSVGCSAKTEVIEKPSFVREPLRQEITISDAEMESDCDVRVYTEFFSLVDEYYIHTEKLDYPAILNKLIYNLSWQLKKRDINYELTRVGENMSVTEARRVFYKMLCVVKRLVGPSDFNYRMFLFDLVDELPGNHNGWLSPDETKELIDSNGHFPEHRILRRGKDTFIYVFLKDFMFGDIPGKLADDANSKDCRGIILDLRCNPGGNQGSLIRLLSYFISGEKLLFYEMRKNDKRYEFRTSKNHKAKTDVPIVVLISDSSASASEILSYILRHYHRAIIVGEKTVGAVNSGLICELSQGAGGVSIEYAIMHMPDDYMIENKGVVPDMAIKGDGIQQAMDILTSK